MRRGRVEPERRERAAVPTDAELVRRAQQDLTAFVALYDRYVDEVYRFCRRRLPRAAAEDATSTAFLNALGAIRGLDPERAAAFRAWLFTIAHHAVIDQLRRREHLPLDELTLPEPGLSPDEQAVPIERRDRLTQALPALGSEQQRVIRLRLAGLEPTEIGAAMGKSPGAIRVIHHRAVARLRRLLGVEDEETGASS